MDDLPAAAEVERFLVDTLASGRRLSKLGNRPRILRPAHVAGIGQPRPNVVEQLMGVEHQLTAVHAFIDDPAPGHLR